MSVLAVALLGAVVGLGLLVITAGLRGQRILDLRSGGLHRVDDLGPRLGLAVIGALVPWLLTGWIAMALAGAVAGWWAPTPWRTRGRHQRELELVEAIATWTEQLRDTLAAANGLEHAIGATARLAPAPIAGAVGRLGARVDYESLPNALRRFADEVDHPMADFVVAALVTAAEKEAREIGALLTHLATCARDEARMRSRVWVGRARTRSAVRIIVVVVVVFVAGLMVLDRDYLAAYDTPSGQVVLAAILGGFAFSFVAMERMGRMVMPERFVRRRSGVAS